MPGCGSEFYAKTKSSGYRDAAPVRALLKSVVTTNKSQTNSGTVRRADWDVAVGTSVFRDNIVRKHNLTLCVETE